LEHYFVQQILPGSGVKAQLALPGARPKFRPVYNDTMIFVVH